MYTLHITWPELDKYSIMGNVGTLLMSCVSQWVVMQFPNFKGRLYIRRVESILMLGGRNLNHHNLYNLLNL